MRHLAILGVMAVASLLAPGMARAESAQDLAWCKGDGSPTLEQQIGGCTALIEAKSGEARTRALNYFRRAGAYLRQQDYDRTISDFGEGLALDAGNAASYFGRAIAYEAKKDTDRAQTTQCGHDDAGVAVVVRDPLGQLVLDAHHLRRAAQPRDSAGDQGCTEPQPADLDAAERRRLGRLPGCADP